MRSQQDKAIIESYISDPYQVHDFISESEREALIEFFNSNQRHVHKHTGPVTVDITQEELKSEPFKSILERLERVIGPFRVWTALYFKTDRPHIIHNDDAFNNPLCYKGINIPLQFEGSSECPELCFFDQYYLDGPSKFFKGSSDIKAFYNLSVYDYSEVKNLSEQPFPDDIRANYFPTMPQTWLEGLSFNSAFTQTLGSITVFDTVRLHCASDFRLKGITSKLGLSIFTEKL
jgi:hypothetical protein